MAPADRSQGQGGRGVTVLRGTLRLLSGQLASKLLDMALLLLLARRLGVESFGVLTYATSFTLIFNVVTDLGPTTVFTREVARTPGRTREMLRSALRLKLALVPVTLSLVLGTALVLRTPPETLAMLAALTVAMSLGSLAGVYEGLLRAAGHPGRVGLALAAGSVSGLVVVALAWNGGVSVWTAVGAQVIAQTVHALVAVSSARAALRRDVVTADEGSPPALGALAMLRSALPLALSWVFIALYFRIDAVMLHTLKDSHAVGLYGGVYRIFEAFAMLTVGFRSVLFPLLARAADGPAEGLAVLCRKSLRLQALFTVLVAVAFGAVAEPLLVFVLGPGYAAAAPGLRVLLWALPGSFMADLLLHVLVAQGRPSAGTWVVGVTAALNIALNLVLIPRLSFVGAAAATVVSEVVCLALLYRVVSRGVPGVGLGALLVRPLLAGGATALALFVSVPHLPAGPWGVMLGLAVGTLVYGGALLASGGLGASDVAMVRGLLSRRAVRTGEVA